MKTRVFLSALVGIVLVGMCLSGCSKPNEASKDTEASNPARKGKNDNH